MIVRDRLLSKTPLLRRWSMRVVKTHKSLTVAGMEQHESITNAVRAVRGWFGPPDRELDAIPISMLEAGSIK